MKKILCMLMGAGLLGALSGCDTSQSPSENNFLACSQHCVSMGMAMDNQETQSDGTCKCESTPNDRA